MLYSFFNKWRIAFLCVFFISLFGPVVRAQNNGIYNVVSYGAKGDGQHDCSPAFRKALRDLLENGGGQLFIPQGSFLLKSRISLPDNKMVTLSIVGLGMGISNILCDNPDGCFQIGYYNINSQITMRDLSFWALREHAGTAVEIEHKKRGNAHHRGLVVNNVEMRSKDITRDFFDHGFRALRVWRPIFSAVVFAGPYGPKISNNRQNDSPLYRSKIAFDVSGAYAPRFLNCYAWSSHTGYKLVDMDNPGAEDGALLNSFAVECAVGVDVRTSGVEPQLLIDGGHYNCRDFGIRIIGRKFVNIINCLMYNVDSDNQAPGYIDIYLEKCNNVIVSNNIFHFNGNTDRKNIVIAGQSHDIDIQNNRFNAQANAVTVEPGASSIRVFGNGFASFVTDRLDDKTQGGVHTDFNK